MIRLALHSRCVFFYTVCRFFYFCHCNAFSAAHIRMDMQLTRIKLGPRGFSGPAVNLCAAPRISASVVTACQDHQRL